MSKAVLDWQHQSTGDKRINSIDDTGVDACPETRLEMDHSSIP